MAEYIARPLAAARGAKQLNYCTMLWVVDEQTGGEFEALHGEFPVVVAGVVESTLNHSILSQLFQHPHRLVLHARLVERCIDKHTLPLLPTDGTDRQIDGHRWTDRISSMAFISSMPARWNAV